jgi:hypothetical protein
MAPDAPNLKALLNMAPSAFASGDIGKLPAIKSLSALRGSADGNRGLTPIFRFTCGGRA